MEAMNRQHHAQRLTGSREPEPLRQRNAANATTGAPGEARMVSHWTRILYVDLFARQDRTSSGDNAVKAGAAVTQATGGDGPRRTDWTVPDIDRASDAGWRWL